MPEQEPKDETRDELLKILDEVENRYKYKDVDKTDVMCDFRRIRELIKKL